MGEGNPLTRAGHANGAGGFALLEVLIALAVLSVGLLGAAALATDTVRAQKRAATRARAVYLATDLVERMRGNRAGALSYSEPPASFGCVSSTTIARRCTASELARHELADWRVAIAGTLPGGTGAITLDHAASPTPYAITIRWRTGAGAESFTLEGWL